MTVSCAACGKRVRKTQRALVMTGPGTCKPGRVCAGCARLGWLLVLGGDPAPAKPAKRRQRASKAQVEPLVPGPPARKKRLPWSSELVRSILSDEGK